MQEHDKPFKHWRMKIPMWKRIWWKMPIVRDYRMRKVAEKIAKEYPLQSDKESSA